MSAEAPSPYPVHPSHLVMVSRGNDLAWLLKWLVVSPVLALAAWARSGGQHPQETAEAPASDPVHPSHRVMISRGSDLAWLLKWLVVRPIRALAASASPTDESVARPVDISSGYPVHPSHRVMVSRGSDLAWLLERLFVRPVQALGPWARRARQRSQLAAMDALMRHDLGLSSALIQREVNKPVWIV